MTTKPSQIPTLPPESSAPAVLDLQRWALARAQARTLVASGLTPHHIDSADKALAVYLHGDALGLDLAQSLRGIWIKDGMPVLRGELMLMLIRSRTGAKIKWLERSDEACEIEVTRPGSEPAKFRYALDDAKRQGLLEQKRNRQGNTYDTQWQKGPRVMLQWRCVAEMARTEFSDILFGCTVGDPEPPPPVAPVRSLPSVERPAEELTRRAQPVRGPALAKPLRPKHPRAKAEDLERVGEWVRTQEQPKAEVWKDLCTASLGEELGNKEPTPEQCAQLLVTIEDIEEKRAKDVKSEPAKAGE